LSQPTAVTQGWRNKLPSFEGEPWGTVAWRSTSFSGFFGEPWERLDDQRWSRIQVLPRVPSP
jgi:hypothetical protein